MNAGERGSVARVLTAVMTVALALRTGASAQQLTFTPYHAHGIYDLRERVGWHVAVAPGQTAGGGPTPTPSSETASR